METKTINDVFDIWAKLSSYKEILEQKRIDIPSSIIHDGKLIQIINTNDRYITNRPTQAYTYIENILHSIELLFSNSITNNSSTKLDIIQIWGHIKNVKIEFGENILSNSVPTNIRFNGGVVTIYFGKKVLLQTTDFKYANEYLNTIYQELITKLKTENAKDIDNTVKPCMLLDIFNLSNQINKLKSSANNSDIITPSNVIFNGDEFTFSLDKEIIRTSDLVFVFDMFYNILENLKCANVKESEPVKCTIISLKEGDKILVNVVKATTTEFIKLSCIDNKLHYETSGVTMHGSNVKE